MNQNLNHYNECGCFKFILYQTKTEEDGLKIKNIYIEKDCIFSLNLMVWIGKECFKNVERPNEGLK